MNWLCRHMIQFAVVFSLKAGHMTFSRYEAWERTINCILIQLFNKVDKKECHVFDPFAFMSQIPILYKNLCLIKTWLLTNKKVCRGYFRLCG